MAWMIASDENLEHLQHYGTPGMKWGVRNYIDENGNLTPAGRERYSASKRAGYTQSSSLQKQKAGIEQLRTNIKNLDGKQNKAEKKKARDALKQKLASYRANAKAERAAYTANAKAERDELRQEKNNLKEVNRYTQYNKSMARSIENMNKFTELIGRYRGQTTEQINARKNELNAKAQSHKNENSRIAGQDVREATSNSNIERLRKAMKNYGHRKGGSYRKTSGKSYGNSHVRKIASK